MDPLKLVDLETLKSLTQALEAHFEIVSPRARQEILSTLRKFVSNPRDPQKSGFNGTLAEEARFTANLSRAKLISILKERGCDIHEQTLLKWERQELVPQVTETNTIYFQWLSENGYEPDTKLLEEYHANRRRKK